MLLKYLQVDTPTVVEGVALFGVEFATDIMYYTIVNCLNELLNIFIIHVSALFFGLKLHHYTSSNNFTTSLQNRISRKH